MMGQYQIVVTIATFFLAGCNAIDRAPIEEKFNLNYLPFDCQPAWFLVGRWEAFEMQRGQMQSYLPYADVIDFGIERIPLFGVRGLNFTGTSRAPDGKIRYQEFGYLLIKNQTQFEDDPKVSFLTATNYGYNMLQEGIARGNKVKMSMLSFGKRNIVVRNVNDLVTWHRREFSVSRDVLTQSIEYEVNGELSSHNVFYKKTLGWPCIQGCDYMTTKGRRGERCVRQYCLGSCQVCK